MGREWFIKLEHSILCIQITFSMLKIKNYLAHDEDENSLFIRCIIKLIVCLHHHRVVVTWNKQKKNLSMDDGQMGMGEINIFSYRGWDLNRADFVLSMFSTNIFSSFFCLKLNPRDPRVIHPKKKIKTKSFLFTSYYNIVFIRRIRLCYVR